MITILIKLLRKGGGYIRGQCLTENTAKTNIHNCGGYKQQKLTSTNLVDTHHQSSHSQQSQIILHSLEDGISRNYSHCERRKLRFMRKFLKMTLRKNLCLQHQRIIRTAKNCKSDHSIGLSEPSNSNEFQ